jgi:hypothetical protein
LQTEMCQLASLASPSFHKLRKTLRPLSFIKSGPLKLRRKSAQSLETILKLLWTGETGLIKLIEETRLSNMKRKNDEYLS